MLKKEQLSMMNLHYQHYTLDYFLDSAVKNQIHNIELWAGSPHLYAYDGCAYRLREIRKKLRERGLTLVCYTPESVLYPFNIASSDRDIRKNSIAYMIRSLENASELEAPMMLLTPGWGNLDESRDEAMRRSLDSIFQVTRHAQMLGITLALEHLSPVSSNLINTSAQLKQALREINSQSLKGMIDTCQVYLAGEEVKDYFELLEDELIHIHIVDGTPGGHLAFGDGDLPMDEIIATIARYNYEGFLSMEISDRRYFGEPEKADRQSIDVYEKILKFSSEGVR